MLELVPLWNASSFFITINQREGISQGKEDANSQEFLAAGGDAMMIMFVETKQLEALGNAKSDKKQVPSLCFCQMLVQTMYNM